jgi:t-SNARE complex subunit (syntaxin)
MATATVPSVPTEMLNMVVSTAVKVNNIEKHMGSYYHNIIHITQGKSKHVIKALQDQHNHLANNFDSYCSQLSELHATLDADYKPFISSRLTYELNSMAIA